VGEADALLCQLEIEDAAIEAAAAQTDAFFCLNAAPAREVSEAILQRADLIVANSFEIDALGSSPLGALFALTLGEEGALLIDDGEEVARARPPKIEAVDGTAAGDAFTACLVVSLLDGRDRQEALERACAAGALAASREGAQPSLPMSCEVDAILRHQ
jgi:ribokinase